MKARWLGLSTTEAAQLAVVVASAWGGALMPSPSVLDTSARPWPTPVVVALLGVFIVAAQRRWPRAFASARRSATLIGVSLALTLAGIVAYAYLVESWTCRYYSESRIMGSELSAYAVEYLRQQPALSCEELLKRFTGRSDEIWTRASGQRREMILSALHLGVLATGAVFALLATRLIVHGRRSAPSQHASEPRSGERLAQSERCAALASALSRLVLAHETILRHAQTVLRAPELIEIPSPANARALWLAVVRRAEMEGAVPKLIDVVLDENPAADELRELALSWAPQQLVQRRAQG